MTSTVGSMNRGQGQGFFIVAVFMAPGFVKSSFFGPVISGPSDSMILCFNFFGAPLTVAAHTRQRRLTGSRCDFIAQPLARLLKSVLQ